MNEEERDWREERDWIIDLYLELKTFCRKIHLVKQNGDWDGGLILSIALSCSFGGFVIWVNIVSFARCVSG